LTRTIRALLAGSPTIAPHAQITGDPDLNISGLAYDSRQVLPGALFVAWHGAAFDGHRFIDAALERGAVAILAERPIADPRARCVVVVPDSRAALAQFAAAFYGDPALGVGLIGVTGTKGKTTTGFLIEALLGQRFATGLIGTVDLKVGPRRWRNPIHQTTPESLDVQRLLHEMVEERVDWAILETSSHALVTHRVERCAYDIAVITNVTHEHLDFHGTYEEYLAAKATLFDRFATPEAKPLPRGERGAVINRDDPGAATVIGRARGVRELTYGLSAASDLHATDLVVDGRGLRFTLRSPWGVQAIETPLLGRFNVYNALAAAGACLLAGLSLTDVATGLAHFGGVPGRVQRIETGQPFLVVVDFAHNADSLEQILTLLRGVATRQVIAVFGSAGERDVAKRAQMGAVCARLADRAIFTDEDPRGEEPLAILRAIAAGTAAAGWREGQEYACIPDRREAIARALALAEPGDIVLLAGKGHENSIIYADRTIAWDEAAEARRALAKLGYGEAEGDI
jgi:UDP-N-acetylmuramoyl-L-alanyl-D-glutamate--2,6-diaminopimelate ligase